MNWIVYALLSAACAGLIPIVAKRGLENIDSTLATAVRAVVMAGCLLLAAALLGRFRHLSSLDRPALTAILASGLAGAASWFFYFLALKHGPATEVAALDRTSIVFTLALAALFLGEALHWRSLLGVSLIVLGVILTMKR
ncbi:MAG: EamA family transporter [Armatimonadetes bacterium]|nr:EamA family transporter [Armatimonadota bacterium]